MAVAQRSLVFGRLGIFIVGIHGGIGAAAVNAGTHDENVDRFTLPQLLHGTGDVAVIFRNGSVSTDGPLCFGSPEQTGGKNPNTFFGGVGEAHFNTDSVVVFGIRFFSGSEIAGDDEVGGFEFNSFVDCLGNCCC